MISFTVNCRAHNVIRCGCLRYVSWSGSVADIFFKDWAKKFQGCRHDAQRLGEGNPKCSTSPVSGSGAKVKPSPVKGALWKSTVYRVLCNAWLLLLLSTPALQCVHTRSVNNRAKAVPSTRSSLNTSKVYIKMLAVPYYPRPCHLSHEGRKGTILQVT